MKTLMTAVALLALGACTTPPAPTTTADATQPPPKKVVSECIPDTGTRLQRCSDELLKRRIGSAQAQEDGQRIQSIANTVGARSN